MSGEADYLIVPGGAIYPLRAGGQQVMAVSGLGEIGVEYQTTRGYNQHGMTVLGWRLTPRSISFQMSHAVKDRRAFWQAREDLIAALRPYVGREITYRKVLPSGARRDIRGWLREGPGLEEQDDRSFAATFTLECPDPSFYDPTEQAVALSGSAPQALAFPFTFYRNDSQDTAGDGFYFDRASVARGTVAYSGTWRAYPAIEIDGPYQWLRIDNTTSGAFLTLSVALAAGRTLTIDLTPGAQSITDDLGNDRLNDRSAGSFIDWYLEAGANAIAASGQGTSSSTEVRLRFYNRYIAL